MNRLHAASLRRAAPALALAGVLAAGACDDGTGPDDGLRFGQIGEVTVVLETPRVNDQGDVIQVLGELRQTLSWTSSGEWRLSEAISYRGLVGDRHDTASVGDPGQSAGLYASWITGVNDPTANGFQLPGYEPLEADPVRECGPFETRVTVRIRDDREGVTEAWTRCATSSLENLDTRGSGPDGAAGRVVYAALLARNYTVAAGSEFRSAYSGSLPFGTLLRGADFEGEVPGGGVIRDDAALAELWSRLAPAAPVPDVDFEDDVVLVARAEQVREEAGDSIEVRRVLRVQSGTWVERVARVAGDFCSPAALRHRPFHVVVSPRVPAPVDFRPVREERVPCPR